jgi:hypothetical protein
MQTIGAADEFWRLRLTRVDTTDELDFEWHDDILYREPAVTAAEEVAMWHVEAVHLEEPDTVVRIATFAERDEAETYFDRVLVDLAELTCSQFEEVYVVPARLSEDE